VASEREMVEQMAAICYEKHECYCNIRGYTFLTLMDKHNLQVSENKAIRIISGRKRDQIKWGIQDIT
jgi:hypothetical protein